MEKQPTKKHTTITIPVTLFKLLDERIQKTGFGSVSSYATYILRETLTKMMEEEMKNAKSKSDKEEFISKMRELGYLH